jgi:hypothetical protein
MHIRDNQRNANETFFTPRKKLNDVNQVIYLQWKYSRAKSSNGYIASDDSLRFGHLVNIFAQNNKHSKIATLYHLRQPFFPPPVVKVAKFLFLHLFLSKV